jgi:acyl carrier protein
MTSINVTLDDLLQIITEVLKAATTKSELSGRLTEKSELGSIEEWDSLSFVAVFMAIGEHFDIELEDDDAIHFTSVKSIHAFLKENF